MIYRKWSLLTGPVAILAAIAVPVTIINYIIVKDDLFPSPEKVKNDQGSTNK
ncbi:hypothetical protein AAG906_005290 [Vitis piasezkii]